MTKMLYSALAGSIAPVKSKDNLNVYHVTDHQNTTQHFIMVTTHKIINTSTMLNLLLLLSHNPQCENETSKKAIDSNCFETLCSHDISLLRKVTKNVFTSHLNLHLLQSLFNLRLSLQLREGGRAAFYWIHWILDVAAVPDLPSHPSSIPYSWIYSGCIKTCKINNKYGTVPDPSKITFSSFYSK